MTINLNQPLPQHPAPFPPLHVVKLRPVSPAAAEAHREIDAAAERLHALEVTAARLAEERDREKTRADGLEAAVPALVAEHVRREEDLAAKLRKARGEAEGLAGVCRRLQDALDKQQAEHRADTQAADRIHAEEVARLVDENLRLIAEARGRWRFSRRRQDH